MSAEKDKGSGSSWQQGMDKKESQAWAMTSGAFSRVYSATKYLKDGFMNSSFVKYQVDRANFRNLAIPDGVELLPYVDSTKEISREAFFESICFRGCNFEGTRLTRIFNLENTQFVGCHFNKYTNLILLAYEGHHGHDKIRERITNAVNANGNVGGDDVIFTVAEANDVLNKRFFRDGNVDVLTCQKHLVFLSGLISSVTTLTGQIPEGDFPAAKNAPKQETTIKRSEQEAIREFKLLANKLAQQLPDQLVDAFPQRMEGELHIGYIDAPGIVMPMEQSHVSGTPPIDPNMPPSSDPIPIPGAKNRISHEDDSSNSEGHSESAPSASQHRRSSVERLTQERKRKDTGVGTPPH